MLFVFFTIFGFGLLIIAIKLRIKNNRLREIVNGKILQSPLSFSIDTPGMYSISLIGISTFFDIKDLSPKLRSLQNNDITIYKYSAKHNFGRKKKVCSCQWCFFVNQKGNYELRFDKLDDFISRYPVLKSRKVKSRKFQTEKLGVLIKEGMKSQEYKLMVLGTLFGLWTFSVGVVGWWYIYIYKVVKINNVYD